MKAAATTDRSHSKRFNGEGLIISQQLTAYTSEIKYETHSTIGPGATNALGE